MEYAVFLGDKQAGKVTLRRQGLYAVLSCRCRLSGEIIYRLTARIGDREIPIGILAPEGDGFGLDRKIPARHLEGGEATFLLLPKHDSAGEVFVPIVPQEPFQYLEQLKDAYLTKKNGQLGAMIPAAAENRTPRP